MAVHRVLGGLLAANRGVVSRDQALRVVGHQVIDRALRSGQLLRLYPCVYIEPDIAADRRSLIRAALLYAGAGAVISHTTALGVWRLPHPENGPIHLTTASNRHLRGTSELCVHRRVDLKVEAPDVVTRGGMPVTRLEQSIVDSWPLLTGDAKRAPAIQAVNSRMTTPARLAASVKLASRLPGRQELIRLVELQQQGCHSPLELWGYDHVFRGSDMPPMQWQVPVRVNRHTVYLDVFDPEVRVNFELDGAKYHTSPADRERDLRRDAALAAMGIVVVRFTHDRLLRDPAEVRRQVLDIVAVRRTGHRAA
jgi:hypothetical protein